MEDQRPPSPPRTQQSWRMSGTHHHRKHSRHQSRQHEYEGASTLPQMPLRGVRLQRANESSGTSRGGLTWQARKGLPTIRTSRKRLHRGPKETLEKQIAATIEQTPASNGLRKSPYIPTCNMQQTTLAHTVNMRLLSLISFMSFFLHESVRRQQCRSHAPLQGVFLWSCGALALA